jgi:hypothetical protein
VLSLLNCESHSAHLGALRVSPLVSLGLLDHLSRCVPTQDTPVLGLLLGTSFDELSATIPCVETDLVSDTLSLHSQVYPKHYPLGLYLICSQGQELPSKKDIQQLSLALESLSSVFQESASDDPLLLLTLSPSSLEFMAFTMEPTSAVSSAGTKETPSDDDQDHQEASCGLLLSPLPLTVNVSSSALESEGGMLLFPNPALSN